MKKPIVFIITLILATSLSFAQDQKPQIVLSSEGIPKMHFNVTEHDFGNIVQGKQPEFVFTFVNEGNAQLVIKEVKTPCSCTAPSYSKDAVEPGKPGEIKVQFNSTGKSGTFVKTVTVYYNSDQSPAFITIKGNVVLP